MGKKEAPNFQQQWEAAEAANIFLEALNARPEFDRYFGKESMMDGQVNRDRYGTAGAPGPDAASELEMKAKASEGEKLKNGVQINVTMHYRRKNSEHGIHWEGRYLIEGLTEINQQILRYQDNNGLPDVIVMDVVYSDEYNDDWYRRRSM